VELLREFIERALVLGAAGGHATLASSVLVGTISSTLVELDRRAAAAATAAVQRLNPDDGGEGGGGGERYTHDDDGFSRCADPSCTMCGMPPTLQQLAATEKRLKQATSVVETLEAAGYCTHLDPTRARDYASDDGGGPSEAAYYSDEVRNVCGALPELWESMPQPESRALLDHIAPSAQSLGCAAAEAVRESPFPWRSPLPRCLHRRVCLLV
jgi:hypothetical protein